MTRKLVLASSNPGKVREIQALLSEPEYSAGYNVIPQSQLGIVDAVEDGESFTDNALIKARHASHHSRLPALADDSGLEVDFLNGEPGVYSARYAGENASDQDNIEKLLNALQGVPEEQRNARFHCVIALVNSAEDNEPVICHGTWEGYITEKCYGENGFGYDPVFYLPEFKCTSAMLSPDMKNKHSHRAKALQMLKTYLL